LITLPNKNKIKNKSEATTISQQKLSGKKVKDEVFLFFSKKRKKRKEKGKAPFNNETLVTRDL